MRLVDKETVLRAGDMPQQVTVYVPPDPNAATTTRDEFNEVTQADTLVDTTWAEVTPLSGREWWYAQETQSESTHKVTIRFPTTYTLTPKHYFMFNGRKLNIESANNPRELGTKLVVMCKEVA